MKLSVLDLSVVPPSGDRQQALRNTLDTAKKVDEWGYTRFWMAEHHATGAAAGRSPEVLIPLVASQTSQLKVGSGAVLLNHYSPFKVAEVFNTLEDLFPGRIDMGIGRATTGPVSDLALQRRRSVYRPSADDSAEQLQELVQWMNNSFEADSPFAQIQSYNNGSSPNFWLLGSSSWSAMAAAKLGLRYAFSGFINPMQSYGISQIYHQQFTPAKQASGLQKPALMLALNVFVAETAEEANRLSAPFQLFERRLRSSGDIQSLLEDEDTAIRLLGGLHEPEILTDPQQPPRVLIGTPDQVRDWLIQIGEAYETDEVMVHTLSSNHEARLRSYQLLADAFELRKTDSC